MLRKLLITLFVLVLLWVVFQLRYILLAAFLGFVFANLFYRVSKWTVPGHRKLRTAVAAGYMLLAVGILLGIVALSLPSIIEQTQRFQETATQSIDVVEQWINNTPWLSQTMQSNGDGVGIPRQFMQFVPSLLGDMIDTFGAIAILIMVTIYGAMAPKSYSDGLIWLMPKSWESRGKEVLTQICTVLMWWLAGRAASMTVVGVLTWLTLWALGIPAPLILGFFAGLLSFIPNLGPILSIVPALLVALTVGPWYVLYVVLVYLGVQAVESNLITPLIQQEAVTVPPALLIVFQVSMGVLAGIWGMIVATPLLVVIMLLVQGLYVRDYLNKPGPLIAEKRGNS